MFLSSITGALSVRSFVVTAVSSRTGQHPSWFRTMSSRVSSSSSRTTRQSSGRVHRTEAAAKTESNRGDEDEKKDTERPYLYLLKSEPHEFSIQDLKRKGREEWDGVRNYTARNYLRRMKVGDQCWFYHSSCKTPAIVGTCRIVREAQSDPTALDPNHENYDPKSTPDNCRWSSCLVEFDSIFDIPITLKELRVQAKANDVVAGMMLLHRSRLSVMPVTPAEWNAVEDLMRRKERNEDLLE